MITAFALKDLPFLTYSFHISGCSSPIPESAKRQSGYFVLNDFKSFS